MEPFTVTSCCCLDLRIGGFVIGYIDLIGQIPLLYYVHRLQLISEFGLFIGRKYQENVFSANISNSQSHPISWYKFSIPFITFSHSGKSSIDHRLALWHSHCEQTQNFHWNSHFPTSFLDFRSNLPISEKANSDTTKARSDGDLCLLSPCIWKCVDYDDFDSV